MRQRRPAAAAIAIAVALALTGCSANSGDSSKVSITFWTHSQPQTKAVEDKLVANYQAAHPNVTINYLQVPFADLVTKLNSAIAAGEAPDLVNMFQSYAPGLYAKGYLAPVDYDAFGVKDQAEYLAQFSPATAAGYQFDGTSYGVPHEVSAFSFFVNNSDFQNAGLDPVADFPKTWDDVATVGMKVQQAPGGPKEGITLSINNPVRSTLILDSMSRQAGKGLFSADGKTAYLNSAEAVRALQTWGDLVHVAKINDPSLGPTASTLSEDLFVNGTAAMSNVGGSWTLPRFAQEAPNMANNYTVGQQPTFGINDEGPDLYGFGLYVPVSSRQQAEAWKFARYLEDNADAYFAGVGIWNGTTAALNSTTANASPHWDVFKELFSRAKFFPQVTAYDEITQIIERAVQRVVLNGDSAQSSLNQAQDEAQKALAAAQ